MPDAASAIRTPLPSARALVMALLRPPPRPLAVARSLRGGAVEFRAVADLVFPADADELMAAHHPPLNRAASRVDAFLARVAGELFAVYQTDFDDAYWEGEEYDQVTRGIPFVRFGWTLEERHELQVRAGYLLLMALCANPDDDLLAAGWLPGGRGDNGWRVALLDALALDIGIPADTLARLPRHGADPAELRQRLDGGPFAAAADFARWFRSETGLACLDLGEDDDYPVPWTRDNVDTLAEEWPRAKALLDRVGELAMWLEEASADRFPKLVDALLAAGPLPESVHAAHTGDEARHRDSPV